MVTLKRIGVCNQCGLCCRREGGLMVENPMIELHEATCKFYTDELNKHKRGHCLIFGRGRKPIETYPTVKDIKAGHKLLPECGFRFEGAIIDV